MNFQFTLTYFIMILGLNIFQISGSIHPKEPTEQQQACLNEGDKTSNKLSNQDLRTTHSATNCPSENEIIARLKPLPFGTVVKFSSKISPDDSLTAGNKRVFQMCLECTYKITFPASYYPQTVTYTACPMSEKSYACVEKNVTVSVFQVISQSAQHLVEHQYIIPKGCCAHTIKTSSCPDYHYYYYAFIAFCVLICLMVIIIFIIYYKDQLHHYTNSNQNDDDASIKKSS